MTNEINRYNHKFTEKAIIENYNEHWMQPFPSFANHNHTKAVGYTLYSGLYFEPQYMCMLNSMFVPETEQDEKNVKKFCYDYLYKERVLKNKKDYDYLKDKLTNYGDLKTTIEILLKLLNLHRIYLNIRNGNKKEMNMLLQKLNVRLLV